MSGAFPFKAARPKGAGPSKPPSMSFELPPEPPKEEPEVQFDDEQIEQVGEVIENIVEQQEEDLAKKRKPGRPAKPQTAPTKPRATRDHTPKFTFAEVAAVFGEDVPFVKVVAKITPVIEILKPEDRKRVVDILVRLYG